MILAASSQQQVHAQQLTLRARIAQAVKPSPLTSFALIVLATLAIPVKTDALVKQLIILVASGHLLHSINKAAVQKSIA